MLKISIITVCYNASKTLDQALKSVRDQSYGEVEHIVIDGGSIDGSLKIIQSFSHICKVISEPDKGMYDALNKGIRLATGDYVGTLNADDKLNNSKVIEQLVKEIEADQKDVYFGDIRFIRKNNPEKTLRYYSSKGFHPSKFAKGYMPAHPSVYIKRELFDKHGFYQTDYEIAADYELLIRFLHSAKASYRYLPILMVDMQPGGRSNNSPKSRYILNQEIVRGCRENGISTNMAKLSLKYFRKVFEYMPTR